MRTEQIKAFLVGILTALICSVLVSAAVVVLRPIQEASREKERVETIVSAAQLETGNVEEIFRLFTPLMVELKTGNYRVAEDPAEWSNNYSRIITNPDTSRILSRQEDIAGIRMVPEEMLVYVLYEEGVPVTAVLPVYGSGLWSVMYAYIAVNLENYSVAGIKFYEHGETPGLGGEIANPRWQAKWEGKLLYGSDGQPEFYLTKTPVRPDSAAYRHSVDSLSGSTLTANGVRNMIYFWFGDYGYKAFLERLHGETL